MRSIVKNAQKPALFLLILTLLSVGASYLLAPSSGFLDGGQHNPAARGFYAEAENSIDIAVIGNSDAYSGFSPMELWNAYGYTAYVSAEGRQSTFGAYQMLLEILTCQSPKLVILETDELFTPVPNANASYPALADTPLSVLTNHDRWKDFSFRRLINRTPHMKRYACKGQKISTAVVPYTGGEYLVPTDAAREISAPVLQYLEKIRLLCQQKGIPLLLVQLPSASSWSMEKHNAVQQYADAHGLPFVDLDYLREEFGLDWSVDTRDGGDHLNCAGARKATLYLADYLQRSYSLPDHRQDAAFAVWNEDYQEYLTQSGTENAPA